MLNPTPDDNFRSARLIASSPILLASATLYFLKILALVARSSTLGNSEPMLAPLSKWDVRAWRPWLEVAFRLLSRRVGILQVCSGIKHRGG
ncbi:uncharacterized protein BDR25DRAFT_383220 [Lindgomyces ingoldianus]|uniref:Uncharacterized protein n=1 Tax=Lindgomyces ingoldianus TaxID=673940 RepID=A0ACB6QA56_9PLEO|nr:uncharacterized protein BDR25DRAFT_383220 [Lindgomyces ingoldianus]KAF2463781.1 hypothetical protein BDR25DRAFT_383220 [Lindgomyces ingoldianus]